MAEQPPFQFDVYISYRSTHKQFVVGELLPRLRSAEITCIAGETSWRDSKRANSAAEITGSGTASRTASFTVHRPSPESLA